MFLVLAIEEGMTKVLKFLYVRCLWAVFTLHIRDAKDIEEICYGLDGPEIESRWRARFSAPVQTRSGAHPASYTLGAEAYQGVKRPERGVNHPP
jgi:hypothetical protein